MISVIRYVCTGCQSNASRSDFYFSTYTAAASWCHYARSQPCQQSGRAIRMVEVQSRPSDRDAGGSGAAGQWVPRPPCPRGGSKKLGNIMLYHIHACYITYMPCYITGCTVLIFHAANITPWWYNMVILPRSGWYITQVMLWYHQGHLLYPWVICYITPYITEKVWYHMTQGQVKAWYNMLKIWI